MVSLSEAKSGHAAKNSSNSTGKKVSLKDAANGNAAKTTASRDAQGNVVGNSTGSKYVRAQEAEKAAAEAKKAEVASSTPVYSAAYAQQNAKLAEMQTAVARERPVTTASSKESVLSKVKSKGSSAVESVSSKISSLGGSAKAAVGDAEKTIVEKLTGSNESSKNVNAKEALQSNAFIRSAAFDNTTLSLAAKNPKTFVNTSGTIQLDTTAETLKRARAEGIPVSYNPATKQYKIESNVVDYANYKNRLDAIQSQNSENLAAAWNTSLRNPQSQKGGSEKPKSGIFGVGESILAPADAFIGKVTTLLPSSKSISEFTEVATFPVLNSTPYKAAVGAKDAVASSIFTGIDVAASKNETVKAAWETTQDVGSKISGVGSAVKGGTKEFLSEEYEGIRQTPVSKAGEYATFYFGGEILGAGSKAAKFLSAPVTDFVAKEVSVGTVKLAGIAGESVLSKGIVKTGTKVASAFETGAMVDLAIGTKLTYDTGAAIHKTYKTEGGEAAVKSSLDMGLGLVIGAPGYKKGSDVAARTLAGDYTAPVPFIKSAKVTELTGTGSAITPVDLIYGKSFAVGDKVLFTYVKGQGVSKGVAAAPKELVEGKVTQAFSKQEIPYFKETVKQTSSTPEADTEYLQSALNIVSGVSKSSKPLATAETFEITSKSVPEALRPAVKEGITTYQGELFVAGSVPMKAAAGEYVTRTPHDLEIYGDSSSKIAKHLSTTLKEKGFVEGIDYKVDISTGKFDFKVPDKGWDTGIEIFTHGRIETASERTITIALESKPESVSELYKLNSGDASAKELQVPDWKSEIAYGYNSKNPVKVETGLDIQSSQEQMARKVAGSTMYHDLTLKPAHANRMKDPLDVITLGSAYAVKGGVPIERDVVSFTEAAFKKWGSENANILPSEQEYALKFQKNVATDPVVSFIHTNKRLPNEAELSVVGGKLPEVPENQVMLFSTMKAEKTGNPVVDSVVEEATVPKMLKTENNEAAGKSMLDAMGISSKKNTASDVSGVRGEKYLGLEGAVDSWGAKSPGVLTRESIRASPSPILAQKTGNIAIDAVVGNSPSPLIESVARGSVKPLFNESSPAVGSTSPKTASKGLNMNSPRVASKSSDTISNMLEISVSPNTKSSSPSTKGSVSPITGAVSPSPSPYTSKSVSDVFSSPSPITSPTNPFVTSPSPSTKNTTQQVISPRPNITSPTPSIGDVNTIVDSHIIKIGNIQTEEKFVIDWDFKGKQKSQKEKYGKKKKQMRNVFGSWDQYNKAMTRVEHKKGLKAKDSEDMLKGSKINVNSTGKMKLRW
jgi:hypothetical protein